MHGGVQQQALSVYKDMVPLALDLFARLKDRRVDAAPPFRALDALTVNNGCRWAGASPDLLSELLVQRVVDAHQGAVPLPKVR